MKPCLEFEKALLDRLGGALGPSAAARLEAHLPRCAACRTEAARLEAALAAARLPPPSEAERRALARAEGTALRAWRGAEGARRNRSLLHGFAAGVAVAAAAALIATAPGALQTAARRGAARSPAAAAGDSSAAFQDGPEYLAAAGAAAAWEPDLDGVWAASALAVGEEPEGESAEETDLAGQLYADLADLEAY